MTAITAVKIHAAGSSPIAGAANPTASTGSAAPQPAGNVEGADDLATLVVRSGIADPGEQTHEREALADPGDHAAGQQQCQRRDRRRGRHHGSRSRDGRWSTVRDLRRVAAACAALLTLAGAILAAPDSLSQVIAHLTDPAGRGLLDRRSERAAGARR